MSINNDTTNDGSLHALRQEARAARARQKAKLQAQLAELRECDQRIAGLFQKLEEAVTLRCDKCTAFMTEKGGGF